MTVPSPNQHGESVDLVDALREAVAAHHAEVAALADRDCRICRGQGWTSGYIAPTKTAKYPCPCTGRADWQRA